MNIAILGYGVEGKSARRFLKEKYPRARIEIRDRKFGADYLEGLDKFDMVVRSPGIPYLTPEIQRAKKAGVEITSATKIFFSALDEFNGKLINTSPPDRGINLFLPLSFVRRGGKRVEQYISAPYEAHLDSTSSARQGGVRGGLKTDGEVTVIGITGTKGKGTVATMLYQILKHASKDVYPHAKLFGVGVFLVGNIGKPALAVLPKLKKNSIAIFELSSFQLQDLNRSPDIAVILEIAPDHLDHHRSLGEYQNAKANIARYQKRSNSVVYIAKNKNSARIAKLSKGRKISVSPNSVADMENIVTIPGKHNAQNAAVASAIARLLGCPARIITKTLSRFKGLPYHLEKIKTLKGVTYYNDSSSTNPVATLAALSAIDAPKILIMGGVDKNFDYRILTRPIVTHNVRLVILYGANKFTIKKALSQRTKTTMVKTLSDAVRYASRRARRGDAVLFSPASASFDMFKNSKDRGRTFTRLAQQFAR